MYMDWTKEELIDKIRRLEETIDTLKRTNADVERENYSLKYTIRTELEPRINAEKRRYDNWVTNPERGR